MNRQSPPSHPFDVIILGGGLAGSILCEQLIRRQKRVLLVDDASLSRCSRVAAGIINPIGGKRLKLVWNAEPFIPFALDYYRSLEAQNEAKLFHQRPLLRLFANEEEEQRWSACSDDPAYKRWTCSIELQPPPEPFSQDAGYVVPESGYLDTNAMISLARKRIAKSDSQIAEGSFSYDEIDVSGSLPRFRNFSARRIVFCEGHLATKNPWFPFIPYKPAKGIIGRIQVPQKWGENHPIIIKEKFIVPRHDNSMLVGSTYNWNSANDKPDQAGIAELESFLSKYFGSRWTWLEVNAGVRPSTAGAYPVVGCCTTSQNIFAFNGFGSRGASQIPYLAQSLIDHFFENQPISQEASPSRFLPKASNKPERWIATDIVKRKALQHIRPGSIAIDATCGNGHDTQWLCEAVGDAGHVFAIDLQSAAINATRSRLAKNNLQERATFIEGNHADLSKLLPSNRSGKLTAVIFNLGYLPGSDKSVITTPESTIKALAASLPLLTPGGILCVTLYPAHAGGKEEADAVINWIRQLPAEQFEPIIERRPQSGPINTSSKASSKSTAAPIPVFIVKQPGGQSA